MVVVFILGLATTLTVAVLPSVVAVDTDIESDDSSDSVGIGDLVLVRDSTETQSLLLPDGRRLPVQSPDTTEGS